MRNLAEHPLTTKEAHDILLNAATMIEAPFRLGDMRPYALRKVAEFIEQNEGLFIDYLKGSK